jgi:hypothetical protein
MVQATSQIPLWHLSDGNGLLATCSVRPAGQAWLVVVKHGGTKWIWEQHRHEDTAMARAAEVYDLFAELGFSEAVH